MASIEEEIAVHGSYDAGQIQVLEGLEAVRKTSEYVYWQYFQPWFAPSGF